MQEEFNKIHAKLEAMPKRMSSGRHVICVDKVDCCLNCIRRRKRKERNWKSHRKNKHKEKQ